MPDDVEMLKAHIMARREAVLICTQELALLSERLRAKIGPVAWLNWMSESVKDGQDDMVAEFIKKQQGKASAQ